MAHGPESHHTWLRLIQLTLSEISSKMLQMLRYISVNMLSKNKPENHIQFYVIGVTTVWHSNNI